MRLTAETAVSDLAVSEAKLESWANKETRPLLRQLRTAANAKGIERATATSDGAGTYITAWTSPELPSDCGWTVTADVTGVGGTVRANYRITQDVSSTAGTVAALAPNLLELYVESDAACDARITVDAVNRVVTVDVRDEATTPMSWTVIVSTGEGLGE
jgi:hypothetical protein